MIFRFLGYIVCRFWYLVLAFWGAALLVTWLAAPPWDEVAQDQEFAFLPKSSPSIRAESEYAKAFPDDRFGSNIVVVLYRPADGSAELPGDLKFIEDTIEPALRHIAKEEGGLASEPDLSDEPLFGDESKPAPPKKRSIIARIRTPNAPGGGALLISADHKALLVVLELTSEFLSRVNWPTIDKVEHFVASLRQQGKIPPSLEICVTGSAVMGRDHTLSESRSSATTEKLTIVLVVLLLVFIYRAPLLTIIPLATVFLSVRISLDLLAILARAGHITLFEGIQTFITVLSYGAGVDYCLFLMARYREELDRGEAPGPAVAHAITGVGGALAASAATVICGIGMMAFAEFGKFREAGYAIPLALLVVLCATLTFSPALLRLAGKWAYWPQPLGPAAQRAHASGRWSWLLQSGGLQRAWEAVGRLLVRRPWTVWLTTVALMAPFAIIAGLLYNHLSYDLIGDLPPDAPSVAGTRILQEHFPAGMMGPLTVLLVNPKVDFDSAQGKQFVGTLTERLRAQRVDLGLADIRSLTAPVGITPAAARAFDRLDLPADVRQEAIARGAVARYVTDLGERAQIGTRLELILSESPFARQSIDNLARLEGAVKAALPAAMPAGSQLYFVGMTASVRDLAETIQSDRVRIEIRVLASVFVILFLLLRRIAVPLYLLASVLFNYYATLGVSFVVFWLLDPQGFAGIDWKVTVFLFTILIAVGEDYNIFLLTRIHEEEKKHGPVGGVTMGLTLTGPIISSCGIIMAGTFASLLAGSLSDLKQLGFALAFGVVLDTFVIRPILVPAFLILIRRGREPAQEIPSASN
jgi:putative drug exporter of the RND superfamily